MEEGQGPNWSCCAKKKNILIRGGLYNSDSTYKAFPTFKAPLLTVENGHAEKLIPPWNFILIL
jgi:hypothetical protein